MTTTIAPRWLRLRDAAAYSGLSIRSLYRLAGAGRLRLARPTVGGAGSRRTLVDVRSLDDLLEQAAVRPAP